jgi:hypothetical protein
MIKNTYIILGLGAILLIPTIMMLHPFSNPATLAQSETTLADRVLSYITQAETSISAGNSTDASDKLGLAIAELSNLIGEISSDDGRYNDTHTHTVTHNDETTHIDILTIPTITMITGSISTTYSTQVTANQVYSVNQKHCFISVVSKSTFFVDFVADAS